MSSLKTDELALKNQFLLHLRGGMPKPYRFVFSKLANELTLITTKKCNLKCLYCYDKSNIKKNALMSKELNTKEIVTLIRQVKKLGCSRVRLTGGEPFVRKDIFTILKECEDMDVNICTNTVLIGKFLYKLKKMNFRSLHIHTSIDGIDTHKKYRIDSNPLEILRNIKIIKKEIPKVSISVNTVINDSNVFDLLNLYKELKNSGIERWTVSFPRFVENAQLSSLRVPPINIISQEFKKLLKVYLNDSKPFAFSFSYLYKYELLDKIGHKISIARKSDHPCLPDSSGCKGLVVDSFGNLLDCLVMPPLLKTPINIKDCLVDENPFPLIIKIYESLKSPFYELSLGRSEDCLQCRYRTLCRSGCPANMWWLSDKFDRPDVISCLFFKTFEDEILNVLPKNEKIIYEKFIDKSKPTKNIERLLKSNEALLVQIGLFH